MNEDLKTRRALPGAVAGRNVFRLEGEYWTIVYDGELHRLPDTAGLRYLAHLLQRPGQKVPAVDLADAVPTPGGSPRTAAAELARVKATRSIRAAMQRLGTHNAPLIAHLRATITTGTFCAYTPDARLPVEWEF